MQQQRRRLEARARLDERHVDRWGTAAAAHEGRQLMQEDGKEVGAPLLHRAPRVGPHKEGDVPQVVAVGTERRAGRGRAACIRRRRAALDPRALPLPIASPAPNKPSPRSLSPVRQLHVRRRPQREHVSHLAAAQRLAPPHHGID